VKTIWKFEVPVNDLVQIKVPTNAKFLSVGVQKPRHLCFWMLVTPPRSLADEMDWELRGFTVVGTGHPIDESMLAKNQFLGTAIDGQFVWHVFGK